MTPSRSDFAFLAHDLNQLLWAIQGRAEALAARLAGETAASAAAIAEDAAAAAAMLAGAEDASAPADPAAVLAQAWRQTRDRARARGTDPGRWRLTGPDQSPPVAMPAASLRRILGNLLANAVEAMPAGGEVICTAQVAGDRIRLSIRDEGPGIPAELRSRLFTPGATSGKADGRGLGLAGARELARRHGGDLVLAASGSGACFELELPSAPAGSTAGEDHAEPPSPSALRILAVDDEAPVRDMLQELLTVEGHRPTLAADHDSALALFTAGDYDAALIDLGLPGRSGAQLAAELRVRDPALALVVITGWGREKELDGLDPALVDLTGTKPLDLAQLRRVLTAAAALTAGRRGRRDEE